MCNRVKYAVDPLVANQNFKRSVWLEMQVLSKHPSFCSNLITAVDMLPLLSTLMCFSDMRFEDGAPVEPRRQKQASRGNMCTSLSTVYWRLSGRLDGEKDWVPFREEFFFSSCHYMTPAKNFIVSSSATRAIKHVHTDKGMYLYVHDVLLFLPLCPCGRYVSVSCIQPLYHHSFSCIHSYFPFSVGYKRTQKYVSLCPEFLFHRSLI